MSVKEFGDAYYLYLQQVFETQSKQTCEIKLARKDGTHFYAQLESVAVQDESGQFSRCRTIVSDITERKRIEDLLRESEERFRRLFEKAPLAYQSLDENGNFLEVNQTWLDALGYTREDVLGRNFGNFLHPEWIDHFKENFPRFKAVAEVLGVEFEMVKKDGSTILVSFNGKIGRDEQGRFRQTDCIFHDITDRKRAEELALQAARLRSVAELSSGVAHHFNNLLQIVIGNTSLSLADLESGDLPEVKTNLEQMLDAATLGAETVRRLQTFANMRADITEGEAAIFDIAATARNAAEVSKPVWKSDPEKKGIKVNLQLNLEQGCLVRGKENEMFEVFVNLIRNAAEAMPQGGDMEVKTCTEADEVVITVRDTGTGIAEEDLPRVFQPFWSSKGVGLGKGMGLAVTHGLVKRHGGSISVQSKVEIGTAFTTRLPLTLEPIRKTEEPATRPAEGKLTILVIEDDERIASLFETMLVEVGHSAFKALSGKEGLAIFNKEPVDLVICDLGMPGMNGWDVGKAIRSICRDRGITKPPFILLTGWGGQELEREKIAESGTDAVVAKPIDSAALLATVQEIAERFNIRSRDT